MKKILLLLLVSVLTLSCAPVLRKDIMDASSISVPFPKLKENSPVHKGKLFILGGTIVNTKVTDEGSLIEAIYIPVDSRGYLRGSEYAEGRFLALYAREGGFLDPLIYSRGREITLAGEYAGIRTGKIGEVEYTYPFFETKDIYLWEERVYYPPPYYSPFYYYPYPYWLDYPWWRHRYYPYYPYW
jgi:outer membrane lipoprotein